MPIFKRKTAPIKPPAKRPTAEDLKKLRDEPVGGEEIPNLQKVEEELPDPYMEDIKLPRPPIVQEPQPQPQPQQLPPQQIIQPPVPQKEPEQQPQQPTNDEAEVIELYNQYVDAIETRLMECQLMMKRLKEIVKGVQ